MSIFVCSVFAVPASAQQLPVPWENRDIGSPALSGSATADSGSIVIEAAGEGIGGTRDQFHFVYRTVAGDVDIQARIDDLERTSESAKAGVMIRSNLTAASAHASALVSIGGGAVFERRKTSAASTITSVGARRARWVRLVRSGTSISAYTSSNGTAWTIVATDAVAMGSVVYVGLAVTSQDPAVRTTARVTEPAVLITSPPAGHEAVDIGPTGLAGTTSFDQGRYTITAAGRGISGDEDAFHFVYRRAGGDFDVIARVESITNGSTEATAGVMIRESLTPGSRHATIAGTRGAGWAFRYRPDPEGPSEQLVGDKGAPPGWVRLVRTATQFEAYLSPDGSSWTLVGERTIAMEDTVLVGIAVSSHSAKRTTTAVLDSFRVTEVAPLPNQPPVIALTSPFDGQQFVAPATVTIAASASDADGTITAVDFYSATTLLGRDTSAPYSLKVSSLAQGTYVLKALGIDDSGAGTMSASVTITVTPGTVSAPKAVAFTVSADHATLVTSYTLEVFWSGTTPGSTSPVASLNLGKPVPDSNGEVIVDCSAFFAALAPGQYIASVSAVGSGGSSRSEAVAFSR